MEKRLVLFLILSSVIFFGWSYLYGKLYPPAPKPVEERTAGVVDSPTPPAGTATPAMEQKRVESPATPAAPGTNVASRTIKLTSDHWKAELSNQGAVITEWTMTSYPNGNPIDPPHGVNLISARLSDEIGGPLRFSIPTEPSLEKELNTAHYEVKD
ncbi:MAG: hypothetical protein J2P41_19860, partial [Blastocatellia bacterium]|nr:hypothetical protein [Blastocatellia bacterium]